jgi:inner membrane protein
VAGEALTVTSSPAEGNLPLPLAASLDVALLKAGAEIPFTLDMELAGTGRIGWVPLAEETTVDLRSAWPHPSFGGQFLPRSRTVTDQGFQAQWRVPALSTQAQKQFMQKSERQPVLENFSVALADPVDVYRLTDRAAKYAMMFIVLTFAAFFVLEMVRRWRIHPMQYLMIGTALVLFFLLLLSFAEQLGFVWAYLLASLGCIGLLTYYLRHVLHGWRPAMAMGTMLTALYGVLYGILLSEDNALMMGSLLLFGVLAGIMVATRKLDWYSVMAAPASPAKGVQGGHAASTG